MAIGDIYRVTIRQNLHGQTLLNVFYYREETVVTTGDTSSIVAIAAGAKLVPPMKAFQSAELGHVNVMAQRAWPLPPLISVIDVSQIGAGAIAGDSLPTSVAAVVKKRTPFAGRAWRGRAYIGGVPVTRELNSSLNGAGITALQAIAAAVDDPISGGGGAWVPVIFRPASGTNTLITSAVDDPVLRNQRRRQVGKGI